MTQVTILPEVIDQIVVDTSGKQPRYIVISHNKKHMQLSPLAYNLLERVCSGSSFVSVAQEMSAQGKGVITSEEVQSAYERVVNKISIIDDARRTERKDIWFKIPLISAEAVQAIAAPLTIFFHPLVAFAIGSSLSILTAYALVHNLLKSVASNPLMIVPAYLLFLLSLFAHEFGHASACSKGGVRPSEIGGAVYLFFPVFYSDVTASWQLGRWQKVRVDIGGIYFQLCVGGFYLLLFLLTRQAVFQLTILMIIGSCILSLNPLLKFDGYWILTDILGVSNLYRQPGYIFAHVYQHIVRRQKLDLRWPTSVCIVLLIYGGLRATLWIYLLVFFSPFLWRAAVGYPTMIAQVIEHIRQGTIQVYLMTDLQAIATSSLILVLWGAGLGRICIQFMSKLFLQVRKRKVAAMVV